MDTKFCTKCQTEKPQEEFRIKNPRTGLRYSDCNDCHKAYMRQHYRDNTETYIQRARIHTVANRKEVGRMVYEYLGEHPCIDCGEANPVCLEFDHVQGEKSRNIADMVNRGCAWRTISAEMAKCVVRCANCHRKKTAHQLGWYQFLED